MIQDLDSKSQSLCYSQPSFSPITWVLLVLICLKEEGRKHPIPSASLFCGEIYAVSGEGEPLFAQSEAFGVPLQLFDPNILNIVMFVTCPRAKKKKK